MTSSPSSPVVVPRGFIRRNNSTPTVHTLPSTSVPGRASMDNYDRARFLRSTRADRDFSASVPAITLNKSQQSPPLIPTSPSSSSSSLSPSDTPSQTSFVSIPAIVLGNELGPLDLPPSELLHPSSDDIPVIAAVSPTPTASFFFGRRSSSTSNTPIATPPASPGLRAAATNPSVSPSPSTTPPSSPSPSFLSTWHGRLPMIPRPSPMTPFRAAKKVVNSVTSVGTGLLPSKEQLGSIPVAGRILMHPVMDSTLTYIASKTTNRRKGAESKVIPPKDVNYFKLNKKLIDQAMTLAALALEREDESKTVEDEAGDDAFELYLAAIATLMHALPIETCDSLRREAFQSQLRGFLKENELEAATEEYDVKQLRRRRRRRHRAYREQASSLIYQHSPLNAATDNSQAGSPPMNSQSSAERSRRHGRSDNRKDRGRRRYGRDTDAGSTLGETIIATAVESAIRLKRSPIPNVVKTCYEASQLIFIKVDERFRLQERAWQLSKQSIEKAIELDQQYAIHELITETFFATVTGLVKAVIAYKEAPSYSSLKLLSHVEGSTKAFETKRSRHPQEIPDTKWPGTSLRRRYSTIEEVEEEITGETNEQYEHARRMSSESSSSSSSSSVSSSSYFATTEEERGYDSEDEAGSRRSSSDIRRQSLFTAAASAIHPAQKVGVVMALRGAASLLLGTLASK
ncbi:hypothetical protein BGZ99_000780 [Dissophora globulifera]|uniref:Uncharacterized protein n=1 Tax=Dissophora globulifera TaxID=979702 RepID=A0A9P6UY34_9FUNG|nr:hypothetical protein BGZ99_000780 [Dissophora globulifera]